MSELAALRARVEALRGTSPSSAARWTPSQQLRHVADAVRGSLEGYPVRRPALVAPLARGLVLRRWLAAGRMSHDLAGGIPGIAEPADGPLDTAVDELVAALDGFAVHQGPLAPHFVFGELDRATWERYHALHLVDHLAGFG